MFLTYFSPVSCLQLTLLVEDLVFFSFPAFGSVLFFFVKEFLFDPSVVLLTHLTDTRVLFTFFILCGII